jgi:hypothetical protein
MSSIVLLIAAAALAAAAAFAAWRAWKAEAAREAEARLRAAAEERAQREAERAQREAAAREAEARLRAAAEERAQREAERAQREAERAQREAERAQREAERAQREAEARKAAERAKREAEHRAARLGADLSEARTEIHRTVDERTLVNALRRALPAMEPERAQRLQNQLDALARNRDQEEQLVAELAATSDEEVSGQLREKLQKCRFDAQALVERLRNILANDPSLQGARLSLAWGSRVSARKDKKQ